MSKVFTINTIRSREIGNAKEIVHELYKTNTEHKLTHNDIVRLKKKFKEEAGKQHKHVLQGSCQVQTDDGKWLTFRDPNDNHFIHCVAEELSQHTEYLKMKICTIVE